jgi:hypothetical protein
MTHNNKTLRNQGDVMASRFVVVPAIPTETGSVRIGGRYYSSMAPCGFDIFDYKEKCRLGLSFPTRAEAECSEKNAVRQPTQSFERDRSSENTKLRNAR